MRGRQLPTSFCIMELRITQIGMVSYANRKGPLSNRGVDPPASAVVGYGWGSVAGLFVEAIGRYGFKLI